jgi:hypothetical protein
MGDLEVSRALGDLQYEPYGLSAKPDITGPWLLGEQACACVCREAALAGSATAGCEPQPGGASTTCSKAAARLCGSQSADVPQLPPHLLLASDGILETMTPQVRERRGSERETTAVQPTCQTYRHARRAARVRRDARLGG